MKVRTLVKHLMQMDPDLDVLIGATTQGYPLSRRGKDMSVKRVGVVGGPWAFVYLVPTLLEGADRLDIKEDRRGFPAKR